MGRQNGARAFLPRGSMGLQDGRPAAEKPTLMGMLAAWEHSSQGSTEPGVTGRLLGQKTCLNRIPKPLQQKPPLVGELHPSIPKDGRAEFCTGQREH